jgi:hypothetical protein
LRTLGLFVALAALAYDPGALAAEPKTVLLLVVAVVLSALAATGKLRAGLTLPLGFAIAFGAWTLLRGGLSSSGALIASLVLAFVVAGLPRSKRIELASWSGIAVGTGAALIAALQWLGGARGMELHGGMGNPNWLGLLLAVTLVPTLLSLPKQRWLAVAAVLQLFAWGVAESRAAWIALPIGLLVAFAARRVRLGWPLAVALVIASVVGARLSVGGASGALASLAGRFWIWKSSLAAALHALPFGTGVDRFSDAYLAEQGHFLLGLDVAEASRTFVHATTAHNEWLHAFTTLGVVGLLLLVALVATGIDGVARRFPAGAGALGALAVGASADVPLHVPAIVVVTSLVLATAQRRTLRGNRIAALAALALCAVLLESSVRQWRATRLATRARDAVPAVRAELLRRAATLTPGSAEAQFAWGADQVERGDLSAGLATLQRSRALSAAVSTDVAIGNALVELGRPAEARTAFARALGKNPGSFRAHANLAVALGNLGDFAAAERELAAAQKLYPGHPKLARIRESLRRKRLERETR